MAIRKKSNINNIIQEFSTEEYDFGFSTGTESDFTVNQDRKIEDYEERLRKIENLILPLLTNLSKNSQNPIIKWPNRAEVLEQKIKELLELTRNGQ